MDPLPEPLSQDPRLALIADVLDARQATDVLLLDLRPVTDVADFFFLCTATSDPHMKALVTDLVEGLRSAGYKPWHVEGLEQRRWVLVDLVDIVIHLFQSEAREFYALERLWGDTESTDPEDRRPDTTTAATSSEQLSKS